MSVQTKYRCVSVLIVVISLGALGAGEAAEPETRPDLNGSRLRAPGQATVYPVVSTINYTISTVCAPPP